MRPLRPRAAHRHAVVRQVSAAATHPPTHPIIHAPMPARPSPAGRFIQLAEELVYKHGVVYVASAGGTACTHRPSTRVVPSTAGKPYCLCISRRARHWWSDGQPAGAPTQRLPAGPPAHTHDRLPSHLPPRQRRPRSQHRGSPRRHLLRCAWHWCLRVAGPGGGGPQPAVSAASSIIWDSSALESLLFLPASRKSPNPS